MTGYLPLCDDAVSDWHVPRVHLATVRYAHVEQEVSGTIITDYFFFDFALYDVALLINHTYLCGLDVTVLVNPRSTGLGLAEPDQFDCEDYDGQGDQFYD
jgi:hypothetical protein